MRFWKLLQTCALFVMLILGLAACEREGPMERAGERADEAVEETGEGLEEAGEETREAVK